ncbi:adenylate/guanylate cyclase domain-containing protein [Ruegeria pomeroyi]|nr:adenylate/guanylate cyclase domain-containing protein [Ruegeria pomeroyi]
MKSDVIPRKLIPALLAAPGHFNGLTARAYILLKIGMPFATFLHVSLLIMTYEASAMPLVYWNLLAIPGYLLSLYLLIRHQNLLFALYYTIIEQPAHALIATMAFGMPSGLFLFALGPVAYVLFSPYHQWRTRVILSGIFICIFTAIFLVGVFQPPWYDPPSGWLTFTATFSALGIAVVVGLFVGLNQWNTERAEDALEAEHARSEALLYNLLPTEIAARLKDAPDQTIADSLDHTAILFADIVDFTPRSARMTPEDLVSFLNRIFSTFDELAAKHGLEKIKTIGDAYMVAAGLPHPIDRPVHRVAEMAFDMLDALRDLSAELNDPIDIRIGLHAGPVVAGVIGHQKLFYDVWGDTVNTASRMESHGQPGRIQVTAAAREALKDAYDFEPRGAVEIKGIGRLETWWLAQRT